jgi:uncharacterized protein (DUF2267 family)
LLVKGVFFDNWKPESVPIKMHREEFVNRVRTEFPFSIEQTIETMISVVLGKVFESMDPHEVEKLKTIMPEDLQMLFEED